MKKINPVKTITTLVALSLLLASCSNGSDSSDASNAAVGAECNRADVIVHIDSLNVDVKCAKDSSGNLVWTEAGSTGQAMDSVGLNSSDEIPAVMQNVGFEMKAFDQASGMAGTMKITGTRPPKIPTSDKNYEEVTARNNYLFLPFGYQEKVDIDPQWAFYLPLGTPVISLISGTVCDVPKLYSDDYSIRVAPDGIDCLAQGRASVLFETEHVIDPLVKFGDRVTAGQKIATVSDYAKAWKEIGFGIVEIGTFYAKKNDQTPWHACPSRFLDPKVKTQVLADLKSLADAWSAEIGMPKLYEKATDPVFGCNLSDVHN